MSRGMTDKEYYNLALSIGKAVNQHENPVKEKHVRSAIIGTFHEKSAATFWTCVLRLPLQDNRIVAWKFCHVLHKVLREGHPNCLPSSQRHKEQIENLGKLWCHLKESYGRLIQLYCTLLNTKLSFHQRNPRFPGNLVVTKEELVNIGENDINNYFQMSVEMFDYMDDILNLQSAIFGSLDMSRSNSMTSSGQCRLAPLIPCIQDASQLYDYCVKILFKLHATLDADLLFGHRERFNKQFRELKQFYINASTLQYFKNLIQIPLLPDNPPNFLVQSDLRSYVTPVVILPHDSISIAGESDLVEEASLIDTSDANSDVTSTVSEMVDMSQFNHRSVSPDVIVERDNTIQHLQQEILRLKNEISNLLQANARRVEELADRIHQLETEVAMKDNELIEERQIKDELLHQTDGVYNESEKKGKVFEDKFEKLKDVYKKLRDEHVNLIRQKAEVEKHLVCAKVASHEVAKAKVEVEARLQEVECEKSRVEETFAQSANAAQSQLDALKNEKEATMSEKLCLASKVDWVVNEKSVLEDELQDLLSQKEELDVRLKEAKVHLTNMQIDLEKENMDKLYQLLVSSIAQSESIVKMSMNEIDNPALSAVTCTPDYFQSLTNPLLALLDALEKSFAQFQADPSVMDGLLRSVIGTGHSLSNYMIYGKTASNTSPDIEFGEHIAETCKSLGATTVALLSSLRDRSRAGDVNANVTAVRSKVGEVALMVERLTAALKGDSAEKIGDLVEDELLTMDKAIEEAAKRIEEMLSKSRLADSGVKLEVNEKILDSCTTLMQAIRVLVQKSRILQAEIVAQGKGTASAKEFYKRNHQWSEGLLSAAKAVAMGAKFLLTSADKVVSGQGKFEQLVVASQEIAASTAQLVVASRVKASRHSSNLAQLSQASKGVTQATGGVVATAKSCSQMVEENEDLDLSKLTLHQAKRLEMESQVHVLELESSLQHERHRLSALRRHHYQLAGEQEGWEAKDMQGPAK